MTVWHVLAFALCVPYVGMLVVSVVKRIDAVERQRARRLPQPSSTDARPQLPTPPGVHLGSYRDAAPKSLQDQVDELRARIDELESRGAKQ